MPKESKFSNAIKLITQPEPFQPEPFRPDALIKSYNGSPVGSPMQVATPPMSAFDVCKSPKLLAKLKEKFEKANYSKFVKFHERVVKAGVHQIPSKKEKSNRKSSSDSSKYK